MRVIQPMLGPSAIDGVFPMDAFLTDQGGDPAYANTAPVLIASSSTHALGNAACIIEGAGLRIADRVGIDAACEAISRQIAASAVWIEVEEDAGQALDSLLDRVDRDVAAGRYAAVVAAPPSLIEPILARVHDPRIEIVIGASEADRVAALAAALGNSGRGATISDIATDKNAARIRQLSEEVSRIASTLARLSEGPAAVAPTFAGPDLADAPRVAPETVRSVIRARRLRSRYFSEELFADPAWDMLLDLLQAEISHLRVPVSSLCIAAAVPATTALRWLKTMVQQGLFVRRLDPHDGRRVFVELAPQASRAMRQYFAEVGSLVGA